MGNGNEIDFEIRWASGQVSVLLQTDQLILNMLHNPWAFGFHLQNDCCEYNIKHISKRKHICMSSILDDTSIMYSVLKNNGQWMLGES